MLPTNKTVKKALVSKPLGMADAPDNAPEDMMATAPAASPRSLFSAPTPVAPAGAARTVLAPGPVSRATRDVSPTTDMAQQTESANPLTGDTNQLPGGDSEPVDANFGGEDEAKAPFTNPTSARIYDGFARSVFGSKALKTQRTGLRRAPANAVP